MEQERGGVLLRRLWRERQGATAIEYALLGALIAVVIVGSVMAVGGQVQGLYQLVANQVAAVVAAVLG